MKNHILKVVSRGCNSLRQCRDEVFTFTYVVKVFAGQYAIGSCKIKLHAY